MRIRKVDPLWVKVRGRVRKDVGDITTLADSINTIGLLHPPVVNTDGKLIAGERRYRAMKQLGWDKIPVAVVTGLDDAIPRLVAERDENTCRKALTPSEAVALGERLERLERPKAKERQGARKDIKEKKLGGKLPRSSEKTRDKVGSSVGMSGKTYEKAKKVIASGDKEAIALMDRTGKVDQAHRKVKEAEREKKRDRNRKKISKTNVRSIRGVFSAVVIDPPWDWGDEQDVNQFGRGKPDYATMSIDEISKLPVDRLADKDCHIYMWITNRSLPKGFGLLDSWGFRYVTMLTWPKPSFGMGNYFRGQTEHVLFGVRGSQSLKRKDAATLLPAWKRRKKHSAKPVEFYDFVESCSPGPYLEMFSRCERKDWTQWGEDS